MDDVHGSAADVQVGRMTGFLERYHIERLRIFAELEDLHCCCYDISQLCRGMPSLKYLDLTSEILVVATDNMRVYRELRGCLLHAPRQNTTCANPEASIAALDLLCSILKFEQ